MAFSHIHLTKGNSLGQGSLSWSVWVPSNSEYWDIVIVEGPPLFTLDVSTCMLSCSTRPNGLCDSQPTEDKGTRLSKPKILVRSLFALLTQKNETSSTPAIQNLKWLFWWFCKILLNLCHQKYVLLQALMSTGWSQDRKCWFDHLLCRRQILTQTASTQTTVLRNSDGGYWNTFDKPPLENQ